MSAGHSEPQVLYSVNNIRAYHVQDGQETELTPSGPQTLSLLMVPTSSPFAETADPQGEAPEEDFYLHLHLPPELDQPLPATTQIYHKPPNSYLIPRWDLGPDAGAFIRIEFPSIGRSPGKVTQEDVDTFETILAQCTAFLERATPPKDHGSYNPAAYAPGEGYIGSGKSDTPQHGQIVLIDEENGSVVGELQQGYDVAEAADVRAGSKNPVEIQLPNEGQGNTIRVTNVDEEYLRMARHPAFQKSTIVQTSARASRLIVTGSTMLTKAISAGSDTFTKKVEPNPKPMTFSDTTHQRIRQIHGFTQGAVGLSAKTVGQVTRYAQNLGATVARKGEKERLKKGFKDGQPDPTYKPGIMNKSMIAFSTVLDGIDQAGRNILASGSAAATTVVGHKYGPEAGQVASNLAGGVRNVGLVYIDAAGVSRKAVIKSVAKGMVVGRMPNGQQIVVGTGDGGVVPPEAYPQDAKRDDRSDMGYQGATPGYGNNGGGIPPPAYSGAGQPFSSQNTREKQHY